MAAMDFRGAVLRGWRLLVLLALVGALVGFFSVPARPRGRRAAARPTIYKAVTIVAPGLGRNSISLARLFLDLKLPSVLGTAAQTRNVGVSASKLVGQCRRRERTRRAGPQQEGVPGPAHQGARHHRGVVQRQPSRRHSPTQWPAAVATYINQQAQASYAANVSTDRGRRGHVADEDQHRRLRDRRRQPASELAARVAQHATPGTWAGNWSTRSGNRCSSRSAARRSPATPSCAPRR